MFSVTTSLFDEQVSKMVRVMLRYENHMVGDVFSHSRFLAGAKIDRGYIMRSM